MNLEPFQPHPRDFMPLAQQGQETCVDDHFANFDQGWNVRSVLVAQHQAFDDDLDSRKQNHVDGGELHATLEMES
jgi:hypothetical protein